MAGPIDKIEGSLLSGSSYKRRYYFTRRKNDRVVPNVFGLTYYRVVTNASGTSVPRSAIPIGTSTETVDAYNKAFKRYVAALGDTAELSVTLAERRQAYDMISMRSRQLFHFFKHLKSGRIGLAYDSLGIPRTGKGKRLKPLAKDFAGRVLETNFGWVPLAQDISSSIDVIQGGIPPMTVKGKGSSSKDESITTTPVPTSGIIRRKVARSIKCCIGSKVQISNPNLWLANQLGFVNAASIAWELVPYSFVVDWFVNVSDVINSFTYDYGLSVSGEYYTVYCVTPSENTYKKSDRSIVVDKFERVICSRYVGPIPRPRLQIRPFNGLSLKRGQNALSLVLQKLR